MSTFVDLRAIPHATKRTTILRIDGDFMISVLENARNLHYNFTGLDVDNGQQLDGANVTDPIVYVRGIKEGTDSRLIIGVNCYYEEDNQNIPNSGLYYYSTKDHFDFEEILQIQKGESTDGKTKAPDPMFTNPVQQFPTQIYNVAPQGTTLSANTATPLAIITAPSQRLYGRLGNLTARRNHLKNLLRGHLDHPDRAIWNAVNSAAWANTDTSLQPAQQLRVFTPLLKRPASNIIFLELMANLIARDINLNTEQKFNLLNGNLSLNAHDLFFEPEGIYGTDTIRGTASSSASYSVRVFGAIGSSSPWTYTRSDWISRANSLLERGGSLGNTWTQWVRS